MSGPGGRPRVGIDARMAWSTGIGRYVRCLLEAGKPAGEVAGVIREQLRDLS